MNNIEIYNFYRIEKQEFSFADQRAIDIKIYLNSNEYMPPTMGSILKTKRARILPGNLGFQLKESSNEIKEKFAENILIQKNILKIIHQRNYDYGYRCGIIKLETGLGKGNLATQIVNYFQNDTLVLVSNTKLLKEMLDRFKEFGTVKPAQYGGGKKEIGRITICTKKSFVSDHKLFGHFKTIIVDEMHQGFTDKFRYALNFMFHDKTISLYGMSGTCYTKELNQNELEKYYGKTIDLEIGYNIIPEFTFLNFHNTDPYEFTQWHELKEQLLDDKIRYKHQKQALYDILKENKYILVLSDRICEIERLYEDLKGGDYSLIKITGGTKVEEDTKCLQDAKKLGKKIIIIGSISKVGTGFDFPMLDTIYLISSIKFKAQTIQAVGRILRIHDEKTDVKAYIWNDQILKKQKDEKLKTIVREYGIKRSDVKQINLNKITAVIKNTLVF